MRLTFPYICKFSLVHQSRFYKKVKKVKTIPFDTMIHIFEQPSTRRTLNTN